MIKIAAIQIGGACWDTTKNLEKAATWLRKAAQNEAQILCLPEMFNNPYFGCEEDIKYFSLAETVPGTTTEMLSQVASETKTIIVSALFEKVIKGEYYDTAVVIGTKGEIIGKYRKMSIPYTLGKGGAKEKYYFRPGNLGFPVFNTVFGVRLGIQVCYDRFFFEGFRALGLGGADLVLVPAAAAGVQHLNVWEAQLRAMARCNLFYVCGVNKMGIDPDGSPERSHFGNSLVASPLGQIVCRASGDQEEIVYADVDLQLLEKERNSWPVYRDRRPEAYGSLVV